MVACNTLYIPVLTNNACSHFGTFHEATDLRPVPAQDLVEELARDQWFVDRKARPLICSSAGS